MGCALISTDTNDIIRVSPTGGFNVVYSGTALSFLWGQQGAPDNVVALDNNFVQASSDGGQTWVAGAQYAYFGPPFGAPDFVASGDNGPLGDPFLDEAGLLWVLGHPNTSPGDASKFSFWNTADQAVTWAKQLEVNTSTWSQAFGGAPFPDPFPDPRAMGWFSDGRLIGLYYTSYNTPSPGGTYPYFGIAAVFGPVGLTFTQYPIPQVFGGFRGHNSPIVTGWYGADRIFAYLPNGNPHGATPPFGPFGSDDVSQDIMIVPVTSPASATVVTDPFGTEWPQRVMPLPDGTAVAISISADGTSGSLWQSPDGGNSWSKTFGPSPHIHTQGTTTPYGVDTYLDIRASYDNPSELWATGAFPYFYTSTDEGLTWTEWVYGGSGTKWLHMAVTSFPPPGAGIGQCDSSGNCVKIDCHAQTGDLFVAAPPGASCTTFTVEIRRGTDLIGMLCEGYGDFPQLGSTMALDTAGNLYIPVPFGANDGKVMRFAVGSNRFYQSNATAWWTTPGIDEHPWGIGTDLLGNIYVLAPGGGPLYSTTTLKLYKLDRNGHLLHTYTLAIPTGHQTEASGGSAVSPDGTKFFYAYNDGVVDTEIKVWDLVNDVALPDFVDDPTLSVVYPQGLRILKNGRVEVANVVSTPPSLLWDYASNGLSHNATTITGTSSSGIFDIAPSPDEHTIYAVDGASGKVFSVDLAGMSSSLLFDVAGHTGLPTYLLAVLGPAYAGGQVFGSVV